MRRVRIRRGLDVEIPGRPEGVISAASPARSVAVLGRDHPGFRPRLRVEEEQRVGSGQVLFEHRDHPTLVVTAPGAGVVARIERGARRALVAIEIELDLEPQGEAEASFPVHAPGALGDLPREVVAETLLRAGLWTALRARPFGRVPAPDALPRALFVTAMDTRPLAPAVEVIVRAAQGDFHAGLAVLRHLTAGPMYLCRAPGSSVSAGEVAGVTIAEFEGPHPAGLAGTHMHRLAPVDLAHPAWHVGYQDVIAVGRLFTAGRLDVQRVVALCGPGVRRPRLVRTRLGASLGDLLDGELAGGTMRVVSGSALHGHHAQGAGAFLGRYDDQVTVLPEGETERPATTTALHGRRTAMVPVGAYEGVLPFDTLPVPLLRALLVGDVETARDLGCLELDEEDLGLCTYVCPAKQDYGPLLRAVLDRIEAEA